jgi:hypothetical protein
MQKLLLALASLGLGLLALSAQTAGTDQAKPAMTPKEASLIVKAQLPSYPFDTCVISGQKLGSAGDPVEHLQDGRLVRLCCKDCAKTVEKDPKSVLKKIDEAVVLAQRGLYPLDTCVVSGEKLGGAMGPAVDYVDGTRLVRFCCGSCVAEYKKDPAAQMAKIDAALIEKLKATYALDTCPVSGEKLGEMGEPVDKLYGVQLVRLCCKGCVKAFDKDPQAALAKVAAAAKTK